MIDSTRAQILAAYYCLYAYTFQMVDEVQKFGKMACRLFKCKNKDIHGITSQILHFEKHEFSSIKECLAEGYLMYAKDGNIRITSKGRNMLETYLIEKRRRIKFLATFFSITSISLTIISIIISLNT